MLLNNTKLIEHVIYRSLSFVVELASFIIISSIIMLPPGTDQKGHDGVLARRRVRFRGRHRVQGEKVPWYRIGR